jgi:hypothetical protein
MWTIIVTLKWLVTVLQAVVIRLVTTPVPWSDIAKDNKPPTSSGPMRLIGDSPGVRAVN